MKTTLSNIIEPALRILPPMMTSYRAKAMMLAIGMQESKLKERKQIIRYVKRKPVYGDGRGLWQFERGGGVHGVIRHHRTKHFAKDVCWKLGNAGTVASVYHGLESDDVLAACFARLLLWTLPGALPGPGETEEGWRQYIAGWRPGKPHRKTWDAFYHQAWEVVQS
jgi:hypothetical protein